jgi:hypothetical protein
MVFCSNCGSQLTLGNEKFCSVCGHKLDQQGEAANKKSFGITGTQGDVIGVGISGNANVIGKNISVGEQQLQTIPKEYGDSIIAFTDALNQQFKANNTPADKVAEVQRNVNEFTKELEGTQPGQDPSIIKKSNLKSKLLNIAKAALPILSETVPVALSAFTPLQPFGPLIGEDIQTLVKAVQKEI